MVMRHCSKAYRGNPPDFFAPMLEEEPARSGCTWSWTWSDEPVLNVQVCPDCDWSRGKQCDECADIYARHRRGDNQPTTKEES